MNISFFITAHHFLLGTRGKISVSRTCLVPAAYKARLIVSETHKLN